MDILVITGSPLRLNSSANLCHRAYIYGLIENGHTVDIIEMSENGLNIDESIELPEFRKTFEFEGSLYSKLGAKRSKELLVAHHINNEISNEKHYVSKFNDIKRVVRKHFYGVYGIDNVWFYNVLLGFNNKLKYDLVISLAYPLVSHKVACFLLTSRRIVSDKWIQIWEDPWSLAPGKNYKDKRARKAERRILTKADEIIYVSPITLKYQKEEFSESAHKMRWLPLPSYFNNTEDRKPDYSYFKFGYFGDYTSDVRNLKPFYSVVSKYGYQTVICGRTDERFISSDNVTIRPRLPIGELKEYEDAANVLVFLCNLGGGQIPGKIYQMSATNKLILFILDGPEEEKSIIKDYFSQFNRYIFCDNNEESIKKAIDSIKILVKDERYTKALSIFRPKNITKCIIDNDELVFDL